MLAYTVKKTMYQSVVTMWWYSITAPTGGNRGVYSVYRNAIETGFIATEFNWSQSNETCRDLSEVATFLPSTAGLSSKFMKLWYMRAET